MLSICIPIYNQDVNKLVTNLHDQAEKLKCEYELVLIDDCSTDEFKDINRKTCNELGKYIELEENVGRAKIRNLFLKHSQQEYLLFLDCDSTIISDNFLSNYIEFLKSGREVVFGGSVYQENTPEKNKQLRWKYGILKESKPAEVRQQSPNKSFKTNNFVIHRSIFEKIRFDERITQYGHEDTLFGFHLQQNNISIAHIDNAVLNGILEENAEFIEKTETSLISLLHILKYINYDKAFIQDVTILNFHQKIKQLHLTFLVKVLFILSKPIIKSLLSAGFANLTLFDFYKLGYVNSYYDRIKN